MNYELISRKYIELVENIRIYFTKSENSIWDRRNKIKIISFVDEDLVVKSFKVPHVINQIVYTFFRSSKAKKSYQHSIQLSYFTPEPIAYVEYMKFGLLYDSYYISKRFEYDFTIREVLLDDTFSDKKEILAKFTQFSFEVHNYNIQHLDYSPGNILIKKNLSGYDFKLIDVNRMYFKRLNNTMRLENFSKLWATDKDLSFIISKYAILIDMNSDDALAIAMKASNQHKHKKNLKKRLKGKKVVD